MSIRTENDTDSGSGMVRFSPMAGQWTKSICRKMTYHKSGILHIRLRVFFHGTVLAFEARATFTFKISKTHCYGSRLE